MTLRDYMRLWPADRRTTLAVLRQRAISGIAGGVIGFGLVTGLFIAGASFGAALLLILVFAALVFAVTVPWEANRFRRGKRPPAGWYRVGRRPKRWFDGERWHE